MNFLTFVGFCFAGSILVGLVVLVFLVFNYDAVIFRKDTE